MWAHWLELCLVKTCKEALAIAPVLYSSVGLSPKHLHYISLRSELLDVHLICVLGRPILRASVVCNDRAALRCVLVLLEGVLRSLPYRLYYIRVVPHC